MKQEEHREGPLSELLRDLSLAWKNLAAYPSGHPAPEAALRRAHRSLTEYLSSAGQLSLQVSREALTAGEARVDSTAARMFAEALYQLNIASLTIEVEVEQSELAKMLGLLAPDPRSEERPALRDQLAAAGVRHIQVEPVDFSRIVRAEDVDAEPFRLAGSETLWEAILRQLPDGRQQGLGGGPRQRSPSFSAVLGLILALLRESQEEEGGEVAGPGATAGGAASSPTGGAGASSAPDPTAVSAAAGPQKLGAGPSRTQPAARLAAGLTRAVALHLSQRQAAPGPGSIDQVIRLIRALPRDLRQIVLDSALRALTRDDRSEGALRRLAAAISEAELLASLRRLSAGDAEFSPQTTRLVQMLAETMREEAGEESSVPASRAESLLGELRQMLEETDIDRFSLDADEARYHRSVLELPRVAGLELRPDAIPEGIRDELAEPAFAVGLAPAVLELLDRALVPPDGVDGALQRLEARVRAFVRDNRLGAGVDLIARVTELPNRPQAPAVYTAAVAGSLERLCGPESLAILGEALLRCSDLSAAVTRRLVGLLGPSLTRHLLAVFCAEEAPLRRHRLLDLLALIGPPVASEARLLLSDDRWHVVRDMILLLRRVGDHSSLPELRELSGHDDPRVRLEAVKTLILFNSPAALQVLERALDDPDDRLAEAAAELAGRHGLRGSAGLLLDLLGRWDLLGRRRAVRIRALQSLARLGDPGVLTRITHFFYRFRLPLVSREERRIAFETLRSYPARARRPLVEHGMRSGDARVRALCVELAAEVDDPPAPEQPLGDAGREPPADASSAAQADVR